MVCWFPRLQPQPFTNLSNVLSDSGFNTLQSQKAAHNGYLCVWQVYFPHSARAIYFHGRVIHTVLVFMRCCIDILYCRSDGSWGRQTIFKGAQAREGSELRRPIFLSSFIHAISLSWCVAVVWKTPSIVVVFLAFAFLRVRSPSI